MTHNYLRRSGLLLLALSLFSLTSLSAKTITVTSTADSGKGTLREAVTMSVDGDEIVFHPQLNGAPIVLNGQIFITKDITITGNGMQNTLISGNHVNRVFEIRVMSTVTIQDVWLYDGITKLVGGAIRIRRECNVTLNRVMINNCRSVSNYATMGGGGVSNAGTLTMNYCTISDNEALGTFGSGGGVLNEMGATLTINNTMISGNEANRAGGGVEDASGAATMVSINNSTITKNTVLKAPGNGGGIHIGGDGSLDLTGSHVTYNQAGAEGGGVWNGTGTLEIRTSHIDHNTAAGNDADQGGGGLYNNGNGTILLWDYSTVNHNKATGTSGSGGGILNNTGASLVVLQATVSGNEANRAGGGIEDASGAASKFTVTDSRIVRNTVNNAPGNGGGIHIGGDGSLTLIDGSVSSNVAGAEGGGIWLGSGRLDVMETLVRFNTAAGNDADQGGGGIYSNGGGTITLSGKVRVIGNKATGTSGSGGGILNNVGATLTITDSEVSGNEANRAGGGIEDVSGSGSDFTIANSMINDNVVNMAPGNGGGIHIGGDGSLLVSGGTVNGNTAGAEGGGIWNNLGTLSITDGAFVRRNVAMGNDPDQGGGGLYNNGGGTIRLSNNARISENEATGTSGSGGGILNNVGSTLLITDSRIIANTANRAGGGIEDASGSGSEFTITDSKIEMNRVNYAPGNGAGIHIGGDGSLTVTGGTINENCAGAEGGGVWNGTGTLSITGTEISTNVAGGNDADQGGAGLYNNGGGTIVLMDVQVQDNRAFGASGSGGGILNNVGGTLLITSSLISGNEANRAGGGIEDASGSGSTFTITDSRIVDNVVNNAPGNGGGIHIGSDGDLTISDGSVSSNKAAAEGGGIWNGMGTLTVTGTLIRFNEAAGNDADQGGGGLYNNGGGTINLFAGARVIGNKATGISGSGGGILNGPMATLTIMEAEIAQNEANRAGGGIEDVSGAGSMVDITESKIMDNRVFYAPGNGGGVHVGGDGSLNITGGIVLSNTAGQEGGGLWNGAGTMVVRNVTLQSNVAEGNDSDNGGGALYNNGGTMEVYDSKVRDNWASGTAGSGGGLFSTGGSVSVEGGLFIRNMSNRAGGAVEILDGAYSSMDTDYEMNDAGSSPGNGGALHVTGMASTIDIMGGSVKGNVAAYQGGGLWNQSGSMMTIHEVSIMDNRVSDAGSESTIVAGGGVFNNGGIIDIDASTIANNSLMSEELTGGGGIANFTGGTVTLMRSTVSGNTAGVAGGGIANDGSMEILNSTITDNTAALAGGYAQATPAASVSVTGTIIADNVAIEVPDFGAVAGNVTSGGYNLIGVDTAFQFPEMETDKEGMSAMLMALADNGGMTMTHRPLCGSPVINMGDPADSSPDQIGQSVFGGTRDIGSFERQSSCGNNQASEAVVNTSGTDVSIFPNPVAGDYLNIRMPERYTGDVILRIVSAEGRVTNAGVVQASNHRLDLSSFAPGAYTLQVLNGEERQTLRFVIAR